MIEATSCGGVVIFRGKILVLYKNYKNKYEGWVLPKGTVEAGEEYKETALREVRRNRSQRIHHQIYRQKPVYLQYPTGCGGKGCTLVSDDGRQLLQQTTAGRVLSGFRILQILRSLPSAEILQ